MKRVAAILSLLFLFTGLLPALALQDSDRQAEEWLEIRLPGSDAPARYATVTESPRLSLLGDAIGGRPWYAPFLV